MWQEYCCHLTINVYMSLHLCIGLNLFLRACRIMKYVAFKAIFTFKVTIILK